MVLKIEQLTNIKNSFGEPYTFRKIQLLNQIDSINLSANPELKRYHDCLLFLMAFPDNQEIYQIAKQSFERLINFLATENQNSIKSNRLLYESGLPQTTMICSFSLTLVKWLCEIYPQQISLYSCDASQAIVTQIQNLLMPKAQLKLIEEGNCLSLKKWILLFNTKKKQTNLQWLLSRLSLIDEPMQEFIFNSLQLFVQLTVSEKMHIAVYNSNLSTSFFVSNTAVAKKTNLLLQAQNPIEKSTALSSLQKQQLVCKARLSLGLQQRETDPITYANSSATEYFIMDEGISVGLFYMMPTHQLALESYIGYMAFKNEIPIAYGGAWLFNKSAKIGINIYPEFRGGSSNVLFAQIIRLYKQKFSIAHFVIEPYQIGKKNSDGIKSGAFWFYYKNGFRPLQIELKLLAQQEFEKITKDKLYRTTKKELLRLSNSILHLKTDEQVDLPFFDSVELSKAQVNFIAKNFEGNIAKAEMECYESLMRILKITDYDEWSVAKQTDFKNLVVPVSMIEGISKWTVKEKQSLLKLMTCKFTSEPEFINRLQHHKKLLTNWFNSVKASLVH